jgi:Uma2 family endonuclease
MPKGEVLVGEAGIRLRRNPDTTVGVDVAYISAETADTNPDPERMVEGVPVLIVEILSPSDKHREIQGFRM